MATNPDLNFNIIFLPFSKTLKTVSKAFFDPPKSPLAKGDPKGSSPLDTRNGMAQLGSALGIGGVLGALSSPAGTRLDGGAGDITQNLVLDPLSQVTLKIRSCLAHFEHFHTDSYVKQFEAVSLDILLHLVQQNSHK
ncbi:hypothetical protein NSS79_26565 [Paenibacillus sp. FSL L8-0436]|uniref:hypothetical protein n=1 Tax=Paenibacillus sp. FSL L8-0436 TaxID=2954686 RepID=UPI0031590832